MLPPRTLSALAPAAACILVLFAFLPVARAQTAVPVRDLTGIWLVTGGAQGRGAAAMPADGKPEHELPFTAFGLEMFHRNKTSNGPTEVPAAEENDPAHACDPQGFPRESLFEARWVQILQTPVQTIMLHTYGKIWRTIWTDGRGLPKDPDPRWFGYSVGRWKDDFTFLVETNGTDERTWLDNAGRPHSEELRVEEVFHRLNRDALEHTLTIHDPKVYSRPWVALDKIRYQLQPANFDIPEMMCSPSELAEYNRRHAARAVTR